MVGCQPISWLPRPTKSEPAPPVPLTDPLLNLGTGTFTTGSASVVDPDQKNSYLYGIISLDPDPYQKLGWIRNTELWIQQKPLKTENNLIFLTLFKI